MNLGQYLSLAGPKYIVVTSAIHNNDPIAKSIAPEPRKFNIDGVYYVAINVEPVTVPELTAYISQQVGVEFKFVQGSGNAALLTHQQVIDLLQIEQEDKP